MTDRLQEAPSHMEQLPPEMQEGAIAYVDALLLLQRLEREPQTKASKRQVNVLIKKLETLKQRLDILEGQLRQTQIKYKPPKNWIDPVGSCPDLPDTFLEDLDALRHSNPPSPPVDFP